jgi:hypothetical protein
VCHIARVGRGDVDIACAYRWSKGHGTFSVGAQHASCRWRKESARSSRSLGEGHIPSWRDWPATVSVKDRRGACGGHPHANGRWSATEVGGCAAQDELSLERQDLGEHRPLVIVRNGDAHGDPFGQTSNGTTAVASGDTSYIGLVNEARGVSYAARCSEVISVGVLVASPTPGCGAIAARSIGERHGLSRVHVEAVGISGDVLGINHVAVRWIRGQRWRVSPIIGIVDTICHGLVGTNEHQEVLSSYGCFSEEVGILQNGESDVEAVGHLDVIGGVEVTSSAEEATTG